MLYVLCRRAVHRVRQVVVLMRVTGEGRRQELKLAPSYSETYLELPHIRAVALDRWLLTTGKINLTPSYKSYSI